MSISRSFDYLNYPCFSTTKLLTSYLLRLESSSSSSSFFFFFSFFFQKSISENNQWLIKISLSPSLSIGRKKIRRQILRRFVNFNENVSDLSFRLSELFRGAVSVLQFMADQSVIQGTEQTDPEL